MRFSMALSGALRRKSELGNVDLKYLNPSDDPADPLVRRAWENIAAREHILYEKHNIHRRAIYARRALRFGSGAIERL